tara:strand:+ start:2904 stop:3860 length:957 start_codon:yes stop_codon:yes gene_type:complete
MAEKTRGDTFITIRSKDLTNLNTEGSSGRFVLFENIIADQNEVLNIKCVSAIIPNSFLNISAHNHNNKLRFSESVGGVLTTITIPDGSYDILELNTKVKSLMDAASANGLTYTFTYDEITNTETITSSNPVIETNFDFLLTDTIRRPLGFTQGEFTITSSVGITSNRTVDITDGRNSIFIRLPSCSNNKIIESSSGKYSNIVSQIPVTFSRNTFFTYEPSQAFECELTQKQINYIDVNITFQDEDCIVDFVRGDWEINLIISFRKIPYTERLEHNYNLNKEIMSRVNSYQETIMDNTRTQKELNEFFKKNILNKNINE